MPYSTSKKIVTDNLRKIKSLFILLGETYIFFIIFIAIVIAALINFISYLPMLIFISSRKIKYEVLYRENLLFN